MVENHHHSRFGITTLRLADRSDISIYIRICIHHPAKLQLIRLHPHRGQRTNITSQRPTDWESGEDKRQA